jgi:hypothetical protein
MNFKKHIAVLALGAALVLPPLACTKDFLDQKDTSNISETALFNKPSDGINLVNAIYDTFHNPDFTLKSLWNTANYLTMDFRNYGADTFYERYEVPTTFDPINIFWSRSYTGIARANSAIPIIARMRENGVIDEALANRLTGEAYFMRGLFYYYLGATFGGVPLELQTVTDNGRHPRNTQDEVFASVVSDMQTAFGLLTWKEELPASELGRANKAAALAYAGSAQMWLKKYSDAIASFDQIGTHGRLLPKFIDIHEYNNKNNAESLFEIQFIVPTGSDQGWGHSNDSSWLESFGMPEEISTFGYHYIDPNLYNSFETGDLRRAATVIGPGEVHPSPGIKISSYQRIIEKAKTDPNYVVNGQVINTLGTKEHPWKGSDNLRSGYYAVKTWRNQNIYGNQTGTDPNAAIFGDQNAILMRFGEVLLSKAEAQFRSGDEAGALATLQIVRNRAFGGVAPASPKTGGTLKVILNEYRHELNGEYSLWYNMRRSGEHITTVKEIYNVTVPNGKDLMPIPQNAIATNETLVQNPGY